MKEFAVRQAGGTAQFSRAEPANNNSNVNNGNSPNYDAPRFKTKEIIFHKL